MKKPTRLLQSELFFELQFSCLAMKCLHVPLLVPRRAVPADVSGSLVYTADSMSIEYPPIPPSPTTLPNSVINSGQKVGLTVKSLESNSATQRGQPTSCECTRSLNKPFEFPEPHPLIYTVVINHMAPSYCRTRGFVSCMEQHGLTLEC